MEGHVVDEDGGRAAQAQLGGHGGGGLHPRRDLPAADIGGEAGRVQTHFAGVFVQERPEFGQGQRRPLGLLGIQHVVHFPELALGARRFGGLRGQFGLVMDARQREVAIDELNFLRFLLELRQHGRNSGAVGSLKVAVLGDDHGHAPVAGLPAFQRAGQRGQI